MVQFRPDSNTTTAVKVSVHTATATTVGFGDETTQKEDLE